MAGLILQAILALYIGLGGIVKVLRLPFQVEHWHQYQYPMWFLTVTGILEVLAAFGLIRGYWNRYFAIGAGIIIIVLMIGAIYTHLFKVNQPLTMAIPAAICLVLAVVVIIRNLK
ncbi:DoxX family protein [Paenibacillus sp. 1001270B_150601_E10]|uniref:DoxX family protein n=1 Tax=Paenibacillus sp. 1001270B_150601_E10 TaxID=2787079 RepID=UPI00189CB058|nr:DoxX family protein [Paenibacillus sp. 1001270B_150601_E10]